MSKVKFVLEKRPDKIVAYKKLQEKKFINLQVDEYFVYCDEIFKKLDEFLSADSLWDKFNAVCESELLWILDEEIVYPVTPEYVDNKNGEVRLHFTYDLEGE